MIAQVDLQHRFWSQEPFSQGWYIGAIGTFLFGIALMFALTFAPTRARRPIIWTVTFLAGAFWVLFYLWPRPVNRAPGELPNPGEYVGFLLSDMNQVVAAMANSVGAFLFGLGIYSLVRLHSRRFFRMQTDWFFSMVLLVSMVVMAFFGYWNWRLRTVNPELVNPENWVWQNYTYDFLFEGVLQQMDAAMFSMIAFFILSAAYRAFRIRSVESTVLMASALLMVLSLMGVVEYAWSSLVIDSITAGDPAHFANNFTLFEVARWVREHMMMPSLRALDFGIGLGALAMALRIWLGLEKGGVTV